MTDEIRGCSFRVHTVTKVADLDAKLTLTILGNYAPVVGAVLIGLSLAIGTTFGQVAVDVRVCAGIVRVVVEKAG